MAIFILNPASINPEQLAKVTGVYTLTIDTNILAKLQRYSQGDEQNWIVYQSPSTLLADYLEVNGDADYAIYSLQVALKQTVEFYKYNRKKCQLISINNLSDTDLSDEQTRLIIQDQYAVQENKNLFYQLLAAYILKQDKSLTKVITELYACSTGSDRLEESVDLNEVIKAHRALKQNVEKVQSELASEKALLKNELGFVQAELRQTVTAKEQIQNDFKRTQEENELLVEKSHQLKEQLENQWQENQGFLSKLEKLEQGLASEQKAREQEQSKAQQIQAELENENELLIDQLHKVQEQFEQKINELTHLEQGFAAEKQARTSEQQKAQKIQVELENKLSKSAEEFQAKAKALESDKQTQQKSYDELQKENELIIEQLHHVQEMFEEELHHKERAKLRIAELQREIDGFEKRSDNAQTYQLWLRASLQKARSRLWSKCRNFRKELKKQAKQVEKTDEFDVAKYLELYPDVKESSFDPAVHYLLYGAFEARNPSTAFNTLNYIQSYPDVAKSGFQPLLHYIKFGQFEGRKADPMQLRLPAPKH